MQGEEGDQPRQSTVGQALPGRRGSYGALEDLLNERRCAGSWPAEPWVNLCACPAGQGDRKTNIGPLIPAAFADRRGGGRG